MVGLGWVLVMNKINLDIVTPVSRVSLLELVCSSIVGSFSVDKFDIRWILAVDSELVSTRSIDTSRFLRPDDVIVIECTHSIGGGIQRNDALKLVRPDAWIYFLDDDNCVHHDLGYHVYRLVATNQEFKKVFVFNQLNKDSSVRLVTTKIAKYEVDSASVLVHGLIAGSCLWGEELCSDSVYLCSLWNKHKHEFVFTGLYSTYWNYLA